MEYIIVDEKVSTWWRTIYKVKADSKKEALTKVIECYKQNKSLLRNEDIDLYEDYRLDLDTDLITVKNNNGFATIEVRADEGDDPAWANGKVEEW